MASPLSDPVPLPEIHRVLVTKLRHHGDVLLASPVFSALKAHAPALEVLAEKVSQAFAVSFSISMARISAASSRLQIATRDL